MKTNQFERLRQLYEELRQIAVKYDITIMSEHQFRPEPAVPRINLSPSDVIFIDHLGLIK